MASLDPNSGAAPSIPPLVGSNGESVTFKIAYTKEGGAAAQKTVTPPSAADAVYFRTPVTYVVNVVATASEAAKADCMVPENSTHGAINALPNGGRIFAEDIGRAFSVERTVSLTIQNGMLTGVDDTHPSEIYGSSQIPAKIRAPIISIPSNLLTLHILQQQNESSLTAARAALLQDQLNVITNPMALVKATQPAAASP